MANYFTTLVFWPPVLLTEAELVMIKRCGAQAEPVAEDDKNAQKPDRSRAIYVYVEDGFQWFDAETGDSEDLGALASEAKAALSPKGELKDVSGENVIAFVLQRALHRMPADVRYISGQIGHGCSKMRPDGFGGAYTFITRQRIVFGSTYDAVNLLAILESQGLSLDIPRQALRFYQALRKIAETHLPNERGHRKLDSQDAKNFIRIARRAIRPFKTRGASS